MGIGAFWGKIDNVCGPTLQNVVDLKHDNIFELLDCSVRIVGHDDSEDKSKWVVFGLRKITAPSDK